MRVGTFARRMVTVNQGIGNAQIKLAAWLVVLLACVSVAQTVTAAETRQLANGITATVYSPAEILGQMKSTRNQDNIEIQTPSGTVAISSDTTGLVPFRYDYVIDALSAMAPVPAGVDVTVYILPAPPVAAGSSFARRDAIYLAPGTGEVDEGTVAYITTHEMGHVLTWAFMDSYPERWAAYMRLRGLDAEANGPTAAHAERAREILAEDIRFLFGGPNATWPGSIENHYLTLPDHVSGLADLLGGFFMSRETGPQLARSAAFPNPCNPLTTVAMDIPAGLLADGSRATLQVFDVRGALVTTVRGGKLANNQLSVQWNGSTAQGMAAASGRYMYVLRAGGLLARGAVTLVR